MSGAWLASYIVLWIVVMLLAFLLAGALRQLGLLQLRLGDDPGALITDGGALVRDEFARLRRESSAAEHAYRDAPAFDVDRIALDEHKLLTSHITR
jgi:hypothetical protein